MMGAMGAWFDQLVGWLKGTGGGVVGWFEDHTWAIWTVTGVTAVVFIASLVLIPMVVAKLPADYFAHEKRPPGLWKADNGALRWVILIGKNVLGVLLVLAGIAMLVLPGQGVLSILIGLVMIDGPGKYGFEKRIVRQKKVRRALNWLRRKMGSAELEIEGGERERHRPDGA